MKYKNTDLGNEIFEVVPLERIDFREYRDYSLIFDKGIAAEYLIIHDIKLVVINPRPGANGKSGSTILEKIELSV